MSPTRKDLADAIAEAKKFEDDPRARLGPLGDIIDAGGGVADLKAKATTAGTFSSEASRQFAQGADSELEELRAIRRNTKKIADKRGQVFE